MQSAPTNCPDLALACAPFTIYKQWLYAVMFRAKWEMRFVRRGDPNCRAAGRKRADVVKFFAGPHSCTCQIRRIHANAWSRPSEALAALGWKHIVPVAGSVGNAMHALWTTLDPFHEFGTVEAWDSNFLAQEGEIVVWELRCLKGRYQNIDYTFNNYRSTYTYTHVCTHIRAHMHTYARAYRNVGRRKRQRKQQRSPQFQQPQLQRQRKQQRQQRKRPPRQVRKCRRGHRR
jgi:hypothetical protein